MDCKEKDCDHYNAVKEKREDDPKYVTFCFQCIRNPKNVNKSKCKRTLNGKTTYENCLDGYHKSEEGFEWRLVLK